MCGWGPRYTVKICVGSCNLSEIVVAGAKADMVWDSLVCSQYWLWFFISCNAETNRAPFDLPEAELVISCRL